MHQLLDSQLKRRYGAAANAPEEVRAFAAVVDEAYRRSDSERTLLEHSVESASRELIEQNHELRRSEDHFRALIESVSDVITVLDAAGTIVYESPSVERMLGYHPDELIGRNAFKLIHPEDAASVLSAFQERVDHPDLVRSTEYRFRAKDGEWRYLESRGRNLLDDPAIRGIVVNSRDITERRAEREALQLQQAHLEQLFHSSPEAVVLLDNDECVIRVNPEFTRLFGYSSEEIWGRNLDTLIASEATVEECTALTREVSEGQTVSAESIRHRKDGTPIHVSILGTPIQVDGSRVAVYAIYRDITDRRIAEEALTRRTAELERSNRELEQFAYVASHDLQEPLRKIQAFGDRLKTKWGDTLGEQGGDYAQRMQGAAARMQVLITDLLAFSRVGTKQQPFQTVDLAAIAREVVSDLDARIHQSEGCVEIGELPTLQADPLQMRQLLQNLIANALKFHRSGVPPRVAVHAESASGAEGSETNCRIRVADNGIGFEEKYLGRIFNPFQRLHGRSEFEGTGMGLAICRKIAERHGGGITAQSIPGQGSTFVITLPLQSPEASAT